MTHIKMPAVAGLFYPGSAVDLRRDIDHYLQVADVGDNKRPLALIAPHAGYVYSGPVAANAYATLQPWAADIRRVVVLAPSHRVPFAGIALSSADSFRTPLGDVPVDKQANEALAGLPGVHVFDAAFAQEHALEVQLPFLQTVLDRFTLVPLVIGDADSDDVQRAIETLQDQATLIVVSSDLSHYHDYRTAQVRDRETTRLIENLRDRDIGPHDACGAYPIRGLLKSAKHNGWRVKTLDLRNSGDTAGDRSRVVGYGAYAFY
ncbi:MAG: AmmeMemoRadiSam system protein B [Gammaproteobacteria bacterium]|nr:AmmeMemoRadiSam system protein B [Gammaproteobacteria bacterium]